MHIKKRMTIMSIVLGVLTLAIGGAVGIPSIFAVRKTLTDVSAAQTKLDDRYAVNRYLSKARDDIAAKKRLVAPLASVSIAETRELDFVTAVEMAAKSSGVKHNLILETASQREISPWQREIPVSMSAAGGYRSVLSFLDAMERMPYLFDIGSLSVVPSSAGPVGETGGASVELRGLVFWIGKDAPGFVTGSDMEEKK